MVRFILRPRTFVLLAALAILIAFPYLYRLPFFSNFLSDFRTFQATRFAIWLVILMGLNLLTGYSGQISLGHAAFVAVGAYIAAILMSNSGVPVFAAIFAAAILTGLIGFLMGIPALRLSGPYLAIATLALIIVLPQVLKFGGDIRGHHVAFLDLASHTGGVSGIRLSTPRVPASMHNSLDMNVDQWLYYNCMLAAVIMTGIAWSVTRSRLGRALIALRDSEIGAQQMGVNVSLYKMTAFGLSSLYAGAGGALYLYQMSYLGPTSFDILFSLTLVVMIVLGGLASIAGAIFAALIMTLRLDLTDLIAGHIPFGDRIGIESSRGAVFGILLIVSIIFTPRGIAGNLQKRKEARPGGPRKSRIAALVAKIGLVSREKEAEESSD
ncbi:MAG TPA: branched-chain amino acid ABC transporter permease [Dehalococcoidia bacterium]|nr:branched-chain amino acid ABC transporter permease [Dehalococcoidia bacterium]